MDDTIYCTFCGLQLKLFYDWAVNCYDKETGEPVEYVRQWRCPNFPQSRKHDLVNQFKDRDVSAQ